MTTSPFLEVIIGWQLSRQRFGNAVSVLLPVHWTRDERGGKESLWVREDGWERIGSWSGDVVGPSAAIMYEEDRSGSAMDAMMACVNNNSHLHPKVLKDDPHPIGGSKETACCIYRNDHGQHLVCAAKVGSKYVVLDCEAPVARFPEFEKLFLFVAKSIRISDDSKQHAEEKVDVRGDTLKLK
jgi:hypothetical protein